MIVRNGGKIMLIGLLHPVADALKFVFKEDFVPPKADKLLFSAGPIIALIPAIAAFAVIPFASSLHWDYLNQVLPRTGEIAGPVVPMQVASINVGILFIFAIASTGIIGAAISGYASDNKYSLLGGIRAASQMVSYEVVLGLTLVPAFMVYASLRLEDMTMWQHDHVWGIFVPPLTLAAINFFVAAVAETKRVPFDLPEGESELVGGYLTEYSGMKFGMFFMGEFVEVVSLAAIASVIFLGGWDVPFLYRDGFEFSLPFVAASYSVPVVHWLVVVIQFVVFLFKIIVLIWFQLMIRWSLPRFRYDQLMSLCWKGLLPISLLNILVVGAFILSGWLDGWVGFFEKLF
jgi:NADH-quinone oxidoreductase subunit H